MLKDAKSGFLFCRLRKADGDWLPDVEQNTADSTMQKDVKSAINAIGLDASLYSAHSAKRAAATATKNAGFSTPEIKRIGRWKSNQMAKRYIKSNK